MDLSNISSLPWIDVARGHLDGIKAVKASVSPQKAGYLKWMGYAADTYKLYNQAHTLGLFQRYPGLIRPIQISAIGISVYNLYTVYKRQTDQVWNWTPKVQALGTLAVTVIEIKEKPMKATIYFLTAAIAFLDRSTRYKYSPWAAKGIVFWNVGWPERGIMVGKEIGKIWSKK